MAHELTQRANGQYEMSYVGDLPWHGLGQVLTPGASIAEWQSASGMDWTIQPSPVLFEANDSDGYPTTLSVPDRRVLFRSDTSAPLSIVSDSYQIVQPAEVLEFFRELTTSAGFALETAGTLFGGKKFWALARVCEDTPIADAKDKVGGFLLLSTSSDGSMATEARWTTVRVVCNNTLSLSRGAAANVRVPHSRQFDAKATREALGLGSIHQEFASAMDTFRQLAVTRLPLRGALDLTTKLLSGPAYDTMTPDERREVAESRHAKAIMHLTMGGAKGTGLAGTKETAWGWLNSVTEWVDHERKAKTASHLLDSSLFGQGDTIKQRAYELVLTA